MRWRVYGERSLYDSEWISLRLVDVELPDGERFEHHIVRIPEEAAAVIALDPERGVLLMRRHRFVVDRWGWELPAGRVHPSEAPAEAAARETLEETGWKPGPLRLLFTYHPLIGVCDQRFHVFLAEGAEHLRDPDGIETDEVAWVPLPEVRELIRAGEISDGLSLAALLFLLAFGPQ